MTIYACPICRQTHDTANPKDKACPQVFTAAAVVQPVSPNPSEPWWDRLYFCPQCPVYAQGGGFSLPEFIEHTASHSSAYLRGAIDDLRRLGFALREMEGNIRALPGLALLYADLAVVRAFHEKDDGAMDAWVARARTAKSCPSCAASATPAPSKPIQIESGAAPREEKRDADS